MIVTFCGHARVDYPPSVREDMLAVLRRFSEGGEDLEFLIGGYGNFDFLALACARTLQKEGVRVRACFVSPYIGRSYSGAPDLNNANSRHTESALFFIRDCFGIKFSLR